MYFVHVEKWREKKKKEQSNVGRIIGKEKMKQREEL
jgi:hypothetical protein